MAASSPTVSEKLCVKYAYLDESAHRSGDAPMVCKFLGTVGFSEKQVDESVVQLLLRTIKMLRRCDYARIDLRSILAHAATYGRCTLAAMRKRAGRGRMSPAETGNVSVLLLYLAHVYTQDETCPISTWHEYLFEGYCNVRDLDRTAMIILEFNDWVLRVDDKELEDNLQKITGTESQAAARAAPVITRATPTAPTVVRNCEPRPGRKLMPRHTTASPSSLARGEPADKTSASPQPSGVLARAQKMLAPSRSSRDSESPASEATVRRVPIWGKSGSVVSRTSNAIRRSTTASSGTVQMPRIA